MQIHNWNLVSGNSVGKFNLGVDLHELKKSGSSPKSHDVWAFITNEKNEQNYLYISY